MFSPSSPSVGFQAPASAPESSGSKRPLVAFVVLVVVVVVGVIVWLRSREGGEVVVSPDVSRTPLIQTRPMAPSTDIQEVKEVADQDRDNLPDAEEARLGTDPTKIDTDGDGVTDFEEAILRRTDPLKPGEPLIHPSQQAVPVQP